MVFAAFMCSDSWLEKGFPVSQISVDGKSLHFPYKVPPSPNPSPLSLSKNMKELDALIPVIYFLPLKPRLYLFSPLHPRPTFLIIKNTTPPPTPNIARQKKL